MYDLVLSNGVPFDKCGIPSGRYTADTTNKLWRAMYAKEILINPVGAVHGADAAAGDSGSSRDE